MPPLPAGSAGCRRGELDLRRVRGPWAMPRKRHDDGRPGGGRWSGAELPHEPAEFAVVRKVIGDVLGGVVDPRQVAQLCVDRGERLVEEREPRVLREDARDERVPRCRPPCLAVAINSRGHDAAAEPGGPAPVALRERERVRLRVGCRVVFHGGADGLGRVLWDGEVLGSDGGDELAVLVGAVAAVRSVGGADARADGCDGRCVVVAARGRQAHDQERARHRARHGACRCDDSLSPRSFFVSL